MGTKMKGLLKGLRYISQIFDEEEEQDIQIGYPTDVKHVAHIGWDGPSVDSASWMKEFKSPPGSAPVGNIVGDPKQNPEEKLVSEDSNRSRASDPSNGDTHDLQKSSRRRHCSSGEKSESPKKESSRRHSRKNMSKESGEHSVKSVRQPLDSSGSSNAAGQQIDESPSRSSLPDIPKKTRRKKSKENLNGVMSSKPSRSKDTVGGSIKSRKDDQVSQNSSMKNHTQEEGVGSSEISLTS